MLELLDHNLSVNSWMIQEHEEEHLLKLEEFFGNP